MNRVILLLLGCICLVVASFTDGQNRKTIMILISFPLNHKYVASVPKRPSQTPSKTKDRERPKFMQAICNFDDAVSDIRNFLKPIDKNMNFIALMYTIGIFSAYIARDGWKVYDDSYSGMAQSLVSIAKRNPIKAIDLINCRFKEADRQIERMRILITNEWIKRICDAGKPKACDDEIATVIKMNNDPHLSRQFTILRALGAAASTYLNMAHDFHRKSKNDIRYLKDFLRPLVADNANVHRLVFRDEDKCYQLP